MRAADAKAHRRTAEEAEAKAVGAVRLSELRASLGRIAGREGPTVAVPLAHLAVGEAEAAGLAGEPNIEPWRDAVERWRAVGQPFRIAGCLLRFAHASLAARRPRAAAIEALEEARTIAARLGAAPLLGEIETLARIARIDLDADDGIAAAPAASAGSSSVGDRPEAAPRGRPFGLTERELEVLLQLVGGLSNRQIGDALFISESTAGVHVSNILGKLGVTSRVEAAAIAVRSGLAE